LNPKYKFEGLVYGQIVHIPVRVDLIQTFFLMREVIRYVLMAATSSKLEYDHVNKKKVGL